MSSAGDEAVELAAMAGLKLDPWEAFVLRHSLGERPDGKWSALEVGLVVPRQNGKGAILEARELAGLFLLGERLIIHSAHEFATSAEHFMRLSSLIENTPEFSRRLKGGSRGITRSHGEEGIKLIGGQRIRFKTRTKGAGRGFSCDLLVLDEAMEISASSHGAMFPTVSAMPNAQVWYTGSAVDKEIHDHGIVLARIRERGTAGADESLAYFEWSADADLTDAPLVATDRDAWAQGNPGLGFRITEEHISLEQRAMDPRTFAVERLGIGDWPNTDGTGEQVIDPYVWATLLDQASTIDGVPCFAADVSPDRKTATIGAAGLRSDNLGHVEVVDRRRGTGWVVERVQELLERHDANEIWLDDTGPAGSLKTEFEERGVRVKTVTAREHAQACGAFFDAVDQRTVRHLGTQELLAAVRGAVKRPLGEAWAWSRKNSGVDISPLVACTLAHWGSRQSVGAEPVFEVLA